MVVCCCVVVFAFGLAFQTPVAGLPYFVSCLFTLSANNELYSTAYCGAFFCLKIALSSSIIPAYLPVLCLI